MSARPLDHRFTAPIRKDGAFATFLDVAGSVELLDTGRAVKVSERSTATRSTPP